MTGCTNESNRVRSRRRHRTQRNRCNPRRNRCDSHRIHRDSALERIALAKRTRASPRRSSRNSETARPKRRLSKSSRARSTRSKGSSSIMTKPARMAKAKSNWDLSDAERAAQAVLARHDVRRPDEIFVERVACAERAYVGGATRGAPTRASSARANHARIDIAERDRGTPRSLVGRARIRALLRASVMASAV